MQRCTMKNTPEKAKKEKKRQKKLPIVKVNVVVKHCRDEFIVE